MPKKVRKVDSSKKNIFLVILFIAIAMIVSMSIWHSIGVMWVSGWLMWLWIALIVIFVYLLYSHIFLNRIKFPVVVIALLVTLIVPPAIGIPAKMAGFGKKATAVKTTGSGQLYDCRSDKNAKVESVAGWNSIFYSGPIGKSAPDPSQNTNRKTFSLKDLTGTPAETTEDLYFKVSKADESYMTGAKVGFEICNADDKTDSLTGFDTIKPAGENVLATYIYFHGGRTPDAPGKYRVDGYLYVDGQWHLVSRISDIVFTD